MTRRKRTKLTNGGTHGRKAGQRQPVLMRAQCKIGEREEEDVLVTDLTLSGCRIRTGAVGVTKSESLVLRIAEFSPIPGRLKWNKGGALGVSFDEPLEPEALRLLLEAGGPPSNVVPLRA